MLPEIPHFPKSKPTVQ